MIVLGIDFLAPVLFAGASNSSLNISGGSDSYSNINGGSDATMFSAGNAITACGDDATINWGFAPTLGAGVSTLGAAVLPSWWVFMPLFVIVFAFAICARAFAISSKCLPLFVSPPFQSFHPWNCHPIRLGCVVWPPKLCLLFLHAVS